MIKPASYWALHKTCDPLTLGRVAATLGGQTVEPPLGPAELALVSVIKQDSEWMDERIDANRERWAKIKRDRRAKDGAEQNPEDGGQARTFEDKRGHLRTSEDIGGHLRTSVDKRGHLRTSEDKSVSTDVHHHPSIRPSVRPSVHPSNSKELINRSVTVTVGGENGNGTEDFEVLKTTGSSEAVRLAKEFADAAKKDQGAFFAPEYDPVSICAALTGDFKSLKRWRQLTKKKGEAAIREEAFAMWREIRAGEDVVNRGAALNKRLGALPDAKEKEAK